MLRRLPRPSPGHQGNFDQPLQMDNNLVLCWDGLYAMSS